MTIVVNFVASCGVGKSLMSALTFAELKMRHLKCEYVQEYAKKLVWQERFDELNNQYTVSYEQYKTIKPLNNVVDYIICDSPLLIGLFYNTYNKDNVSNTIKTEKMILDKINEFNNIYVYLERNEKYPFEQAGRMQTESEAKENDEKMKELLIKYNIPHLSIVSDKNSVSKIIEYILSFEL